MKTAKLVVKGDRFTPTVDDVTTPCVIKLEPSATPRSMVLVVWWRSPS